MVVNVKLVKVTTSDLLGEDGTETYTNVFGETSNVGQKEFFSAQTNGFKAEMRVTIYRFEYSNQDYCEIDNVRYRIYRAFEKDDLVELYLTKRLHG